MKKFETSLPEGYKLYKTIDAKDKKLSIIMNIVALVVFVICFSIGMIFYPAKAELDFGWIWLLIFFASSLVYIVAHELVHGLFYKIFTKRKLKFGFTGTVAYCGAPDIYTYKTVALITTLAPLVVFGIGFIVALLCTAKSPSYFLLFLLLTSIHFSGCVGDMYVTIVLAKLNGDTLTNDNGYKQTIYVKE